MTPPLTRYTSTQSAFTAVIRRSAKRSTNVSRSGVCATSCERSTRSRMALSRCSRVRTSSVDVDGVRADAREAGDHRDLRPEVAGTRVAHFHGADELAAHRHRRPHEGAAAAALQGARARAAPGGCRPWRRPPPAASRERRSPVSSRPGSTNRRYGSRRARRRRSRRRAAACHRDARRRRSEVHRSARRVAARRARARRAATPKAGPSSRGSPARRARRSWVSRRRSAKSPGCAAAPAISPSDRSAWTSSAR